MYLCTLNLYFFIHYIYSYEDFTVLLRRFDHTYIVRDYNNTGKICATGSYAVLPTDLRINSRQIHIIPVSISITVNEEYSYTIDWCWIHTTRVSKERTSSQILLAYDHQRLEYKALIVKLEHYNRETPASIHTIIHNS